ncbi:hypothetical protein P872_00830 [Rhodonellum psychrophilum GCM71 = DSM 17998]|uniref:Uncharacterized protein n=1 Tax=Rhodonellum psychrophilum GCM71 = DSM 17998 TaxID=1123057 RepID=U5C577_9BACT|nr:hypothetical protein P872_00830 [Rhodonellum psychrophilum GCM71 = DSM 17998]
MKLNLPAKIGKLLLEVEKLKISAFKKVKRRLYRQNHLHKRRLHRPTSRIPKAYGILRFEKFNIFNLPV